MVKTNTFNHVVDEILVHGVSVVHEHFLRGYLWLVFFGLVCFLVRLVDVLFWLVVSFGWFVFCFWGKATFWESRLESREKVFFVGRSKGTNQPEVVWSLKPRLSSKIRRLCCKPHFFVARFGTKLCVLVVFFCVWLEICYPEAKKVKHR